MKKVILLAALLGAAFQPLTASAHTHHSSHTGHTSGSTPQTHSSGTAWAPESAPMPGGLTHQYGPWSLMMHGYVDFIYDDQGGRRGDEKAFSQSMLMGMASRPLGQGQWDLRAMLSLDALMGKSGYPLLLQTGETADGEEHLIDRQHPHDFFMELATQYTHPLSENSSAFIYLGYPGEPALGPAAYMHSFTGMENPEAPITHHWLDSTHITFGVATLGYVWDGWKVEASAFNGQEPDQYRWNFDDPRFSSYSGRLTYNPTDNWSMQVSQGHLKSPEQLEPDVDQVRTTASATYNKPFGHHNENNWQTTLAWGRNNQNPGGTFDAWRLESAVTFNDTHTVFGRAERAEKNELFHEEDEHGHETFNVGKLSIGYAYTFPIAEHVKLSLGGLGSMYDLPSDLDHAYSNSPLSYMLFTRLTLE